MTQDTSFPTSSPSYYRHIFIFCAFLHSITLAYLVNFHATAKSDTPYPDVSFYILYFMLAGLIYDNLVLYFGNYLWQALSSTSFYAVQSLRFILHSMLPVIAILLAHEWALFSNNKTTVTNMNAIATSSFVYMVTLLALAYIVVELALRSWADIEMTKQYGLSRYTAKNPLKTALPPILMTLITLGVGIRFMVADAAAWHLVAGSMVAIVLCGGKRDVAFYTGNLGEVFYILGFVLMITSK